MLLPFGNSTVVETVIDRIKHSDLIDFFLLATTTDPSDDVFKEIAAKNNIMLFRGSEDDVVSRMWLATNELHPIPDIIVRVCSDNPLLMPSIVDKAIVELVNANADVITPAEFNTYPFGYSMVAMTIKCLERIEIEAKEETYREHVENFCFEHPENFKILYQKAPEKQYFKELNLTLDYEVDYLRLKNFRELLDNTPLNNQPDKLISVIKNSKIAVIVEEQDNAEEIAKILAKYCLSPPLLFYYSQKDTQGPKSIAVSNSLSYSEITAFVDDDISSLLNEVKNKKFDLIVSTLSLPEGHGINASRGRVLVDTIETPNEKKYCLRYDIQNGGEKSSLPKEPIFIDFKMNDFIETKGRFLCRILPFTLHHLMAGPVRSAKEQEAFYPPAEKQGTGKRKGFPNRMAVNFPPVILLEMVEKIKRLGDSKLFFIDDFFLNKFTDEIGKYPINHVVIGIYNAPQSHPDFNLFYKKLKFLLGAARIIIWPNGELYRKLSLCDSLFQQIILTPRGLIMYSTQGNSFVGDFADISLAEAWRSKKIQLARVDILNSVVLQ